VSLGDRGIATSNQEKTMAASAQMWQSKMFTEDQMVAWENRMSAMQTWAALQTYFTEKWLERKQYSSTTAKQSRFKEAALQAQEAAAAEEEGKTQAMLFEMLQDQHTKQITQMEATNKANMEAMMDKMNALVASNPTRQNHTLGHTPFFLKSTPTCTCNTAMRMHSYAHPQHLKVLKRFAYICHGWGMLSLGGWSLNHHTTISLRLSHTPIFLKSTPTRTGITVYGLRYLTVKLARM